MKNKAFLLLILATFLSPGIAKEMQPDLLDPRITHVGSSQYARIVAYRNCDEIGNCWSDVYFQLVFPDNSETPTKCTTKIKELEHKYIVQDSGFMWEHGDPVVKLVFAKYDDFKEIKREYEFASIVPEPDCSYKIYFYNSNG